MDKRKQNRVIYIISILIMIFVLVFMARTYVLSEKENSIFVHSPSNGTEAFTTLTDNWVLTREDGSTELISLPCTVETEPGECFTISHAAEYVRGRSEDILFDNCRCAITVRAGSEKLYEVNRTILSNQVAFTGYRVVTLPENSSFDSITLSYTALGSSVEIPEIYCASYNGARDYIITTESPTLVLLLIFIIAIIVTSFIFAVLAFRKRSTLRFASLILFLLAAMAWGLSDSNLLALTNLPQEFVGTIDYVSLMIMPMPIILFYYVSFDRSVAPLRILIFVSCLNVVLQCTLSAFGVFRLNSTFFISHLLILSFAIVAIYSLIRSIRKAEHVHLAGILLGGGIELAVGAVVGVILYWLFGSNAYRTEVLATILFLDVILLVYLLLEIFEASHEQKVRESKAQLQKQMLYTDELTGLNNRRAFEEKIHRIDAELPEGGDAVLIMMDVNGLKTTNDTFGHTAGDELLISAAEAISKVFSPVGTCYRIGGDEYTAIITDSTIPVISLYKQLDEVIEHSNYSSRWKLSIARGESHLLHLDGTRLSVSDWKQEADIAMYRNKLDMNSARKTGNEQDLRDIIDCIITTVEAKDIYTASHSKRVRELSLAIGQMLGLSEQTLSILADAAYLHDIGKIGIPDGVLMKAGRLTPEEYDIIKEHPAIGAKIVSKTKGMGEISEIILHHHERYDGKGYPEGISGNAIPLESRIIAIADSIDAMTSKRCYRDNMTIDDCRGEIEKNIGKMYDPAIASIVLKNWNEIQDIILLHPKRLEQD